MPNISTVAAQDKLTPRREPYWAKITLGCYLGFRKMAAGSEGSWLARCKDETTGKQQFKALGDFNELARNKRHDAAKKEAQAWLDHLGRGGSNRVVTISEVCADYVSHLRTNKGDTSADDAQGRLNRHVLNDKKFSALELTALTPPHLDKWRKALKAKPVAIGKDREKPRSDSAFNRDMTCFRAALNLAFEDGLITSDFAWRSKLLPIKNADKRRDVYLDKEQRRKWIEHAEADLAIFLQAMSQVPLRPKALSDLTVAQFDKRLKTIKVGKDKNGQDRKLPLPDATAEFFATLCKDKLPGAPLLTRSNGKAWNKDAWKHPVKKAVKAAGLPDDASCYSMRHSVITDLVHGGTDTLTVAQLSGTSVAMIEKHYGHLTGDHARKALSLLEFSN